MVAALGKAARSMTTLSQDFADLRGAEKGDSERELRIFGTALKVFGFVILVMGGGGIYTASKDYKQILGVVRIVTSIALVIIGIDLMAVGQEVRDSSKLHEPSAKQKVASTLKKVKKKGIHIIGDATNKLNPKRFTRHRDEKSWLDYCQHTVIIKRIMKRIADYSDPD